MEGLTTTQHAERIAESLTNGQRKQACEQFKHAHEADGCNPAALLTDIQNSGVDIETCFWLAGKIIDGGF